MRHRFGASTSVNGDALMAQQPTLALDAAAVAGERAVGADHPMAGHDQADRVGAVGQAHRPNRRRLADALREAAVAECRAGRDVAQGLPNRALEGRAASRANDSVRTS